jgi:hypothetical protein
MRVSRSRTLTNEPALPSACLIVWSVRRDALEVVLDAHDGVDVALVSRDGQGAAVHDAAALAVAPRVDRHDGTPTGEVDVIRVALDLVEHERLVVQLLDDGADVEILEDRVGGGEGLGGHLGSIFLSSASRKGRYSSGAEFRS